MKRVLEQWVAAAFVFLLAVSPVVGQQADTPGEGESVSEAATPAGKEEDGGLTTVSSTDSQPQEDLLYVPPRLGHLKPTSSQGGGVRSASLQLPEPLVLAPLDHVGLTTSPAPGLFWFVDGTPPATAHFELTVIRFGAIDPLLEVTLPLPERAGVQRVDLAAHGVTLDQEVAYQWSVTLVVDPEDRSLDRVSIGGIARSAVAASDRTPRGLAAEGLWYDTLETLSDAMDARPEDLALQRMRDSLLTQAGLEDAVTVRR